MSKVFVLDTHKRPLDPVHPGHARLLLKEGKAAIFRRYPFTIIRKAAGSAAQPEPLRVKLDPGSKTTGLALVNYQTGEVMWAGEITHRGGAIRQALLARRARRRSRRTSKTRHRAPRFLNRRRPEGWLPPSLESRVANVVTWVERLRRVAPIGAISLEVVRFDTQALQNPHGATTPQTLRVAGVRPLGITARVHGSRQICRTDRYGFPTRHCERAKRSFGMRTGDIVRAVQARGIYTGTHVGRVTSRQRPRFRVNGHDFHPRLLTVPQRADGYDYTLGVRA